MSNTDNKPVLYVIIRNDMDSQGPGRACAQAAHAANQFVHDSHKFFNHDTYRLLQDWQDESGYGYGTTIVLSANMDEINAIWDSFFVLEDCLTPKGEKFVVSGMVTDEEYHLRDGRTTHLLPVDTCMYLFGLRNDVLEYVQHLPLYS